MKASELPSIEDATVEYKLKLPETESLARILVAMANAKGGRLIIGVREGSREIVGVSPNQRVEEHVANVAADVCAPQVPYELSYETTESGAVILVIQVMAGFAKPYYLKKLGPLTGTYVRVGSTCRLADREMVKRLTREGENRTFDSEVTSRSISEIDPALFDGYLKRRKERLGAPKGGSTPELLEDLQLALGGKLTVAGALLFTQHPDKTAELSGGYIRAARFATNDRREFIDQQDFSGPLTLQIDEAVKFLLRNTRQRSARGARVLRDDSSEYSPLVLREIVTNAVVHRDYSLAEECIHISIFDDRIEVLSPGPLPGTITPDNIMHRQRSRNPIIAKRMFEMGYIEGWGLGIDTIVSWAAANKRLPPKFNDDYGQVAAIIYSIPQIRRDDDLFSTRESQVLEQLKTRESISNQEVRDLCGLTKTQAQTVLKKLVKRKIIVVKGRGRSVRYRMRNANR